MQSRRSRLVSVMSVVLLLSALVCTSTAGAQDMKSYWGVTGSYAPSWTLRSEFRKLLFEFDDIQHEGKDLEIGFVRGRELGGDWGVSYVRRDISKSVFSDVSPFTSSGNTTYYQGNRYTLNSGAIVNGLEMHKFVSIVTVKKRVQFGLNFGIGVGSIKGTADNHAYVTTFTSTSTPPFTTFTQTETHTEVTAKEAYLAATQFDPYLLGKAEIMVAGIITPKFKVKFSGGLNYPGLGMFRVGIVYFPTGK